jgi:OOP family OmpA-OmpF porin
MTIAIWRRYRARRAAPRRGIATTIREGPDTMKKILSLLALATCALLATSARAQQGPAGVVLGVAGGISKFNDSCAGTSSCDTTDRALRLNAGYGFGNGLVVEAVSFNFGKIKATSGGISAQIDATAIGGGVAYYATMSPTSALFTRLGLAGVKAKASGSGFGAAFADSESQKTLYAGIGFAWNLSQGMALELAWETTQIKYGGEQEAVSAATVGLSLRF